METTICFFDDYFIANRQGAVRRYFKPTFLGYLDDKNYNIQTYTSFFYDEKIKKFRAYYEVTHPDFNDAEARMPILALADTPKDFTTGNFTSTPIKGWLGASHGCGVAYNPDQDLFVMVGNCNSQYHKNHLPNQTMLSYATSKDGVNFEFKGVIHNDYSDTLNSICYNPYTKQYIVTMRSSWGDRRVNVMKSYDLINWTKPEIILYPTATLDNYGAQHYALGISNCNGTFYGILWRYVTDLNKPDFTDMAGIMENDLYYSLDGVHYAKALEPVCSRPLAPAYGSKQMWLQNVCDSKDGKFILFGSGSKIAHGEVVSKDKWATSILYEIRKDGFCALEGTTASSLVCTKNFAVYGDKISINCNCLGGTLSYALANEKGQPYEGFSFEDCEPIKNEDCICKELKWAKPISELKGKKIRIIFKLYGCLLYSITFDGALWTVFAQKSFCEPIRKE